MERVPEEEPGLVLNYMEVAFVYALLRTMVPESEEARVGEMLVTAAEDYADKVEARHMLHDAHLEMPRVLVTNLKREARAFLVEIIGEEHVRQMEESHLH
jgi:hypothetical protein